MDLTRLARSQYGVITRAQALADMSIDALRWRLKRRNWCRVYPGVYATHAEPLDWMARASAALLYCGPRSALAVESAAHLLDLDDWQPPLISIAIPAEIRRQTCAGFLVRRRRRLDTVVRKRLRVTSPAFTVLDVGDKPTAFRDDAIAIAARAVQRRKTTVDALRRELQQRRTHQHREAIELSLGIVADGAESVLEVEFATRVLRAHGLPTMRMAVPDRVGGFSIRRDFVDDAHGVVIEVDGRVAHEGRRSHDIRRDRRTAAQGRVTLRAEWVDVRYEPCALAAQVFATLRSRGYGGVMRSCAATCRARTA